MTQMPIVFTRGVPPAESFPKDRLAQAASDVLAEYGDVVLQYGPSRGFEPLRALIAEEKKAKSTDIILGQGSLQLLDLYARMTIRPGDVVYLEAPTYDRTLTILKRAGAEIAAFPVLSDGLDVDAVETSLKQGRRPSFFYLIPDFQNPSGTTLSLDKRVRILELASTYGFLVIEDIPYRRLRYRGEESPSFRQLAPEITLQLSSYSKLIAPGLRVGYVLAPTSVSEPLAKYAEDTYINASYFNQALVYKLASSGWLDMHLMDLIALYTPRLDTMLASLDAHLHGFASWHRPDGGFFMGVNLDKAVPIDLLKQRAAAANLQLTDGRGFFANGDGERFLRLPFCALKPEEIQEGIARLAGVIVG
jgi:2-aminoadipate transaminase